MLGNVCTCTYNVSENQCTPTVEGGIVQDGGGNTITTDQPTGTSVTVVCNDGYTGGGSVDIICDTSKEWTNPGTCTGTFSA